MTISNNVLIQLGLLSVNFENFQKNLEYFIWALICDDQLVGQTITSNMNYKNICGLANNLFQYKCSDNDLKAEFEMIIKIAGQVEEKRNIMIHSAWAWNPNSDSGMFRIKLTAKNGKGLNQTLLKTDAEELRIINQEFIKLLNDFLEFESRIETAGIINLQNRQLKTKKEIKIDKVI